MTPDQKTRGFKNRLPAESYRKIKGGTAPFTNPKHKIAGDVLTHKPDFAIDIGLKKQIPGPFRNINNDPKNTEKRLA